MKGREVKGPPAADLLACFPSRAHLTVKPKSICSPARLSEHNYQRRHHHHHPDPHHHHQLRKSSLRGGAAAAGHASPVLWAKRNSNDADISEPTSPEVTCAGQIKVRPRPSSCKNWQSVMEEIERLHNSRKQKKRSTWIETLGIKKDVMQFLTCLRNIRFDFRCFGSFTNAEITSDDEEDDAGDEDEDLNYRENSQTSRYESGDNENSRAVFSKWFMILQENNQCKELIAPDDSSSGKMIRPYYNEGLVDDKDDGPCAPPPPPNALLLMRCRSAPAKRWLEEKVEQEEEEKREGEDEEGTLKEKGMEKEEEEKRERKAEEAERRESSVVMRCGTDFSKISSDITKETWDVGGIRDMISRSQSWKR